MFRGWIKCSLISLRRLNFLISWIPHSGLIFFKMLTV